MINGGRRRNAASRRGARAGQDQVDAKAAPPRDDLASTWVPSPFTARPLHRRLSLVLWTPVVVGIHLLVLGFAVAAFGQHSPEPLSDAGITAFFAVLFTLLAAWHIVPFVEADHSGATVHGITRRIHLPWSAIDDVRLLESSVGSEAILAFQTPEKQVRTLAPSGSPEPGKPMDVHRTKLLLYRDRMRDPGERAGPITRSGPSLHRKIAVWAYLLMPAWFILAYYLDGGH
jgi:hypothetical protein